LFKSNALLGEARKKTRLLETEKGSLRRSRRALRKNFEKSVMAARIISR